MASVDDTYIKVSRKILQWEWYQNTNTKSLFIHLLLMANIKSAKFQGRTIKRGQLVTSLPKLKAQTGLSVQSVRTALNHLKSTGEITCESTSQYTVITIKNYDYYQSATYITTGKQQTTNRQSTGNQQQSNKVNKVNKGNKEKGALARDLPPAVRDGEMTMEEYQKRAELLRR